MRPGTGMRSRSPGLEARASRLQLGLGAASRRPAAARTSAASVGLRRGAGVLGAEAALAGAGDHALVDVGAVDLDADAGIASRQSAASV